MCLLGKCAREAYYLDDVVHCQSSCKCVLILPPIPVLCFERICQWSIARKWYNCTTNSTNCRQSHQEDECLIVGEYEQIPGSCGAKDVIELHV